MAANQTHYSRLEQWSDFDFWWFISTNHEKFTEVCVLCMKKFVLVKTTKKKNVYKWTKRVIAITSLSRKDTRWSGSRLTIK